MPADLNGVDAFWRLGRESMLLPAVPLIENFDSLLLENRSAELASLLRAVESFSPLTFLSGSQRWTPDEPSQLFLSLECPAPNSTDRMNCWRKHLHEVGSELDAEDLIEISSKFNFTPADSPNGGSRSLPRGYRENPALPQSNAKRFEPGCVRHRRAEPCGLARKSRHAIRGPHCSTGSASKAVARDRRAREKAQLSLSSGVSESILTYGKGVTTAIRRSRAALARQ